MKRAAIGVRTHSGWGALVAVSTGAGAAEILARKRVTVIAPETPGVKQPYHFCEHRELADAQKFLGDCFVNSERLAAEVLRESIEELRRRKYEVAGFCVVMASGRELPELPRILTSHALIHTAEGEFFREVFWAAGEALDLAMVGFRERDLEDGIRSAFGKSGARLQHQISTMGRSLGPPWTADQKIAALAALLVLSNKQSTINAYSVTPNFQHLHPPLLK